MLFKLGTSTQNLGSLVCLSPPIDISMNGELRDHMIWKEFCILSLVCFAGDPQHNTVINDSGRAKSGGKIQNRSFRFGLEPILGHVEIEGLKDCNFWNPTSPSFYFWGQESTTFIGLSSAKCVSCHELSRASATVAVLREKKGSSPLIETALLLRRI